MKLWKKYIIGTLSVFGIIGSSVLGAFLYSRTESAKGVKQTSIEPMEMRLNELKDIKKYDISFRSPLNTKKTIGKFELNIKTQKNKIIWEEGKINGQPAQEWIENYYKEHSQPPVMFIYAGKGIKFTNFYTEVIFPNDFIKFVHWFAENVAWTPGLTSISSYIVKRGIEEDNGIVTLGSYSAVKGEKKEIKFMPDSFYGEINFKNYLTRFNSELLTKKEIQTLIAKINKHNEGKEDSKKIIPYSIEKKDKDKYNLYVSNIGKSLVNIANKLYSKQIVVSDLDIQIDDEGKTTLENKDSKKIKYDSRISKLSFLRAFASPKKWRGIGLNFLKYVTTHEYGHMQTLSMSMDASNKPVVLQPSANSHPNAAQPSQQVNIDVLNNYFDARIPFIRAKRVSPKLYQDPKTQKYRYLTYEEALTISKIKNEPAPSPYDFTNVAFEIDKKPQENNDSNIMLDIDKIFAGDLDPTNPNNMLYSHSQNDPNFSEEIQKIVAQIKKQIQKGENHFQFLMRDVKDLSAFAKFLGVPVAAVMFMNANDNYKPTVSPLFKSGWKDTPFGKELTKDGENWKWVDDNVFNVKAKDDTTPWFLSKEKEVKIPEEIKDNLLKSELLVKSTTTNNKWYINPKAALSNSKNDKTNLKEYLMSFKEWFEDVLLKQDLYRINGNEFMHRNRIKPWLNIYDDSLLNDWIINVWEGYVSSLKSVFSDYTSLWSEVLTRDWVQMTYVPNFESSYKYDSKYTKVTERDSGIELYLNPESAMEKDSQLYKWIFDTNYKKMTENQNTSRTNFLKDLKKNDSNFFKKIVDYKKDDKKKETTFSIFSISKELFEEIKEDFSEKYSNNGYYKDRWLRAMLKDDFSGEGISSWVIYDDDGKPIVDPNIKTKKPTIDAEGKITFNKLQGKEQNRANAFWWWFLESYGVGNRTVTGLWRVPEKNGFSMWGYLPTILAQKVKYIKFTKDNETKYIPVYIKGTNNLFYLKHQGDKTSKHYLAEDGFSSWSIDMLVAGTWTNALLEDGKWKVEFVDKNKKPVIDPNTNKNAFTLGSNQKPGAVKMLTNNNKHSSYAPIRIENKNGQATLVVKEQFAI